VVAVVVGAGIATGTTDTRAAALLIVGHIAAAVEALAMRAADMAAAMRQVWEVLEVGCRATKEVVVVAARGTVAAVLTRQEIQALVLGRLARAWRICS
jgi:hypothetical protein